MTDFVTVAPPPLKLQAPYLSDPIAIKPEWIDYNGHLNMAYYNVVFDRAVDAFFETVLGFGPDYLEQRNRSIMTAEIHVRYLREVMLGDPLHVALWLLDVDDKRVHFFQELRHTTKGFVSATSENMILHVDMNVRKVAPCLPDMLAHLRAVAAVHAKVPRPDGVGRRVAMPAKT